MAAEGNGGDLSVASTSGLRLTIRRGAADGASSGTGLDSTTKSSRSKRARVQPPASSDTPHPDGWQHADARGEPNVHVFKDIFYRAEAVADAWSTDYASHRSTHCPIVIDNGSSTFRCGWATDDTPRIRIHNYVAKPRNPKEGIRKLVGSDIAPVLTSTWFLRAPMEHGVVINYDLQECVLDHAFARMGIDTEGSVEHPVLMSECLCNPGACRARSTELLFEQYAVPQVCYGVDAAFSHLFNASSTSPDAPALILSCGEHATFVMPYINGRIDAQHAKRIDVGCQASSEFINSRLALKHPQLRSHLSLGRAKEILQEHVHVASDFSEEIKRWEDTTYWDSHTKFFQLPFEAPTQQSLDAARALKAERTQRLKDALAQRREEKLTHQQHLLADLQNVLAAYDAEHDDSVLSAYDLSSRQELVDQLEKIEAAINKLESKIAGVIKEEQPAAPAPRPQGHLLDVPSAQLTPEQTKEKARQRLALNAWEYRQRARAEQEAQRVQMLEATRKEEAARLADPERWLANLRSEHKAILVAKAERQRLRDDLADRRSSASKARMRLLVQQAHDVPAAPAKGRSKKRQAPVDDGFGANDEDWNVYRAIDKDNDDDEEEVEAREHRLQHVEELLEKHDPEFANQQAPQTLEEAIARTRLQYRLQLDTEQIRAPELVFQPTMIGVDQMGLAEAVAVVLQAYPADMQDTLAQNIFLTGGGALYPGLKERIEREVRMIRPFGSKLNVRVARDPLLDPWHGAAQFARRPDFASSLSFSRAQHLECGPDYLVEHAASNAR
eukprot:m.54483 g.54483  ORF g.54483 m.54483 type:complete len:785 (+) comp12465_c0_seq2:47-2401(+)